jgi:hypothetical protein
MIKIVTVPLTLSTFPLEEQMLPPEERDRRRAARNAYHDACLSDLNALIEEGFTRFDAQQFETYQGVSVLYLMYKPDVAAEVDAVFAARHLADAGAG